MIYKIASSSGKPLWKKVGEKAITKAVETTVEEGVKAIVDLWKTRHMKELDIEFEERKKARKAEAADSGSKKEQEEPEDVDEDDDLDEDNEGESSRFAW